MASLKLPTAAAAPLASCTRADRALGVSQVRLLKRGGGALQRIEANNAATAIVANSAATDSREYLEEGRRGCKGDDGLRLLSTWASPFGMRVKVALHEKGLDFEYGEELLGSFSPEVMLSNPIHKKIPVLLHNGNAVCESRIILEYIDEQWPASSSRGNLMPSSPWARAQARFWSDFVDTQFCPDSYDIVIANGEKQQVAIKKTIQHLHRIDRDALNMKTPQSLDSTKKEGPFFNNENTIGFFDITFVGMLQWLRVYEFISPFKIPNAHECPRLHAWIEAICEEASVQKSIPNLELLIKRAQTSRCSRDFDDWNNLYKS